MVYFLPNFQWTTILSFHASILSIKMCHNLLLSSLVAY